MWVLGPGETENPGNKRVRRKEGEELEMEAYLCWLGSIPELTSHAVDDEVFGAHLHLCRGRRG